MPRRPHPIPALSPVRLLSTLTVLSLGVVVGQQRVAAQQHAGHTMSMPMSSSKTTPVKTTPSKTTPAKAAALPLAVSGARVVAVPPGIGETSFFAVLKNSSAQPITLRGAQADVAGAAMLMQTVRSGALTGMREAPALTIPARGTLTLSETGDHVMLMGLKRSLNVGERVTVTLVAADGRRLRVAATVLKPGQ